jgi:hypothetical protein
LLALWASISFARNELRFAPPAGVPNAVRHRICAVELGLRWVEYESDFDSWQ